ncbi:MAG: hypothetical protein EP315_06260 [Gammaproteobacteria bacterium]|nr:MAG: hypothetical protein EP315_06260 [Gammaproteobacteria bacterium]
MKFQINELKDHTASLMTDMGYVLGYFRTIDDARQACDAWYSQNNQEQKFDVEVTPYQELSFSNKLLSMMHI